MNKGYVYSVTVVVGLLLMLTTLTACDSYDFFGNLDIVVYSETPKIQFENREEIDGTSIMLGKIEKNEEIIYIEIINTTHNRLPWNKNKHNVMIKKLENDELLLEGSFEYYSGHIIFKIEYDNIFDNEYDEIVLSYYEE